jgi:hypothetical protein
MYDTVTFYKIRHKKTNRWSKGGVYASGDGNNGQWVEKGGKTWDTLGKLRAHITTHMNKYNNTDMSDWEVVEYKSSPSARMAIHEVVDPKKLMELLKQ